jgi:hypothetical protein
VAHGFYYSFQEAVKVLASGREHYLVVAVVTEAGGSQALLMEDGKVVQQDLDQRDRRHVLSRLPDCLAFSVTVGNTPSIVPIRPACPRCGEPTSIPISDTSSYVLCKCRCRIKIPERYSRLVRLAAEFRQSASPAS